MDSQKKLSRTPPRVVSQWTGPCEIINHFYHSDYFSIKIFQGRVIVHIKHMKPFSSVSVRAETLKYYGLHKESILDLFINTSETKRSRFCFSTHFLNDDPKRSSTRKIFLSESSSRHWKAFHNANDAAPMCVDHSIESLDEPKCSSPDDGTQLEPKRSEFDSIIQLPHTMSIVRIMDL